MKKTICFLYGLLIISIVGCQDLDLNPLDTGSSNNWYQTETHFEMSLKGLYRVPFWKVPDDSWSDDFQYRNFLSFVAGGTITSENGEVKLIWDNMYKAISRANIILSKIDEAISNNILSKTKGEIFRAEALFIRAQMYATLVTYFGDVVFATETISLEEAFKMGRTDKNDIIKQVYQDFDNAAEYLPTKYQKNETERATKGASYAFKTRFALFNGDWQIASEAAKSCIDLDVYQLHANYSNLFLPSTRKTAETIFSLPRSLELGTGEEQELVIEGIVKEYLPRNIGGYGAKYPSWDLLLAYTCTDGEPVYKSPLFNPQKPFENRDPRCTATIVEFDTPHMGYIYDPSPKANKTLNLNNNQMIINQDSRINAAFASYTGLLLKKGIDESWYNNGTFKVDPDIIMIRLADVYLMYAEAMIEQNKIDQTVLDAINKVRARAYEVDYKDVLKYPAITVADQASLRKIVRTERRMELAFEGWRYYDIIRWRLADKLLNRPDYGMLDPKELIEKLVDKGLWFFPELPNFDEHGIPDYTSMYSKGLVKVITNRKFDAKKQYLFPIPAKELIINDNITQNPNY